MKEKTRNCGSCRHFHNKIRTWCLRYPPVAVDNRHAFYPSVGWDNTCGEWTPREKTIKCWHCGVPMEVDADFEEGPLHPVCSTFCEGEVERHYD